MKTALSIVTVLLVSGGLFFDSPLHAQGTPSAGGFAVHEWGTFTSIAGPQGKAVQWMPLADVTDLPEFVEHLDTRRFKLSLSRKVRMETPVLYFYTSDEKTVSVDVSFEKGLITEWFPHAVATPARPTTGVAVVPAEARGSLHWDSVQLEPSASSGAFATENRASHYYAARETSATPVRTNSPQGDQTERFLFYRGVSDVELPLEAKVLSDGSIAIKNLDSDVIPNAILFERRGDKTGYRVLGSLRDQSAFTLPELFDGSNNLPVDLEGILVQQGLYRDEAHAMVQTWKDSWFEEGARLFYIVPRKFVDSILPLTIEPAPASTMRVFVGRVELVTPQTERAVESAFDTEDRNSARKYGRFLEPILSAMIERASEPRRKARLERYLEAAYSGWSGEPQVAGR